MSDPVTHAAPIERDLVDGLVGATPTLSPLETLRHSTAHVMAKAVQRLFPGTRVTIGPAIETGFYYDFDRGEPFTEADLAAIEAEMTPTSRSCATRSRGTRRARCSSGGARPTRSS